MHTSETNERELVIRTCANVALVKYWGKEDVTGNVPAVGSLSIGLDDLETRAVMGIGADEDRVVINGAGCGPAVERAIRFLDAIRTSRHRDERFVVESANNFPTGAGLASSASGFAALALGANRLLDLGLDDGALSALAREGSGSAARSVFGGFVEMSKGPGARARKIADASDWPLEVVIAVTASGPKETGSTSGMELTRQTSPFYQAWVQTHDADLGEARSAVAERDFERLARVGERSCLKMHAAIMGSDPGLIYWNGATVEVMHQVRALRAGGTPAFFSIDAGPQVKVVCLPGYAGAIARKLEALPGVIETIETRVGGNPSIEVAMK